MLRCILMVSPIGFWALAMRRETHIFFFRQWRWRIRGTRFELPVFGELHFEESVITSYICIHKKILIYVYILIVLAIYDTRVYVNTWLCINVYKRHTIPKYIHTWPYSQILNFEHIQLRELPVFPVHHRYEQRHMHIAPFRIHPKERIEPDGSWMRDPYQW